MPQEFKRNLDELTDTVSELIVAAQDDDFIYDLKNNEGYSDLLSAMKNLRKAYDTPQIKSKVGNHCDKVIG